jgi:hypothetical protein
MLNTQYVPVLCSFFFFGKIHTIVVDNLTLIEIIIVFFGVVNIYDNGVVDDTEVFTIFYIRIFYVKCRFKI